MKSEDVQEYVDLLMGLFSPIVSAVEDPDEATRLLVDLGYVPPSAVEAFSTFSPTVGKLHDLIDSLAQLIETDDTEGLLKVLIEIFRTAGELFRSINAFSAAIQNNFGGSDFLSDTDILTTIVKKLADYLIVRFLEDHYKTVHAAFLLVGIIDVEEIVDTPTQFHAPYLKRTVNWDNIPDLFSDPINTFKSNLIDGTTLYYRRLIYFLYLLGIGFDYYTEFVRPNTDILKTFNKGNDLSPLIPPDPVAPINDDNNLTPLSDINPLSALRFPLLSDPATTLGLVLYPVMDLATQKHVGLGIGVGFGGQLQVPLTDAYEMLIKFSANLNESLGVRWATDGKFTFINKIVTPNPEELAEALQFGVDFSISPTGAGEPEKVFIIGTPQGSHLEIGSGILTLGFEKLDSFRMFVETDLKDGEILLVADGADGFLSSLLPAEGIRANFNLGIGISNKGGLYFKGASSLYIRLPLHMTLGPINIDYLGIGFGFEKDRFPLTLVGGISAYLGPLLAVVEDIGVRAVLMTKPDRSGNLGPLDLAFGFQPPKGVGLAIDAGAVKGGGYLFFDFDKGEYAGVLELDLSGIISVKAIGLITTKLPDGSPGFSLLLIITAEFGTPVQLGFGFTLSGVGGLLGLNRTMRLEVIATGIRDGGINSVMFPQDVVANAPRIISDLKKYFPVEEGTFLIGPMVKIGWGTPNLVTVSLGIIIEIPGNIAILGVLKVVLPDEAAPLIVIQVNFMGAIEFDKSRLWFFASIFESRILFMTLEGEMGLLVGWGDEPAFVVSVGGFHPAFNPPPLPFGAIARLAISILNTDFARIRVEAYFAVTSNSVQFGAAAELFFGVSAFNIDGHLSFDALFRFSPFYFIITISASLSVKVFGIGLFSVRMRGSLEGPTPWHVEGTGSISLLFFDIDVDFSHTWGNEEETTLPPIAVAPLLVNEFQKLENWLAVLPASNKLLVSIRNMAPGTTDLILHPVGGLKISQRAVPLGLTIDKVGNQKPSDANLFNVSVSGLAERRAIEESFAVGQFFDKSDDELLSAKSFEPLKGGVELSVAGEQYHSPKAVRRVIRYEKIIIDTLFKRFVKKVFPWVGILFNLFANGNAVALSALSSRQQKQLKPFADKVQIGKNLYVVARSEDNTPFDDNAVGFTSQTQAQEFLKQQIAGDANLAKQLHVIPQVEMQRTE